APLVLEERSGSPTRQSALEAARREFLLMPRPKSTNGLHMDVLTVREVVVGSEKSADCLEIPA
ncbi:MAG: hypothetical protein AAGN64_00675, partial [Bacteroidota bacterium]